MINKIRIKWLEDKYICKTCGEHYARGAEVYLNDMLIIDCRPMAHCCESVTYTNEEIYNKVFKHLGYEYEEDFDINDK
jgi:hypothetical protein